MTIATQPTRWHTPHKTTSNNDKENFNNQNTQAESKTCSKITTKTGKSNAPSDTLGYTLITHPKPDTSNPQPLNNIESNDTSRTNLTLGLRSNSNPIITTLNTIYGISVAFKGSKNGNNHPYMVQGHVFKKQANNAVINKGQTSGVCRGIATWNKLGDQSVAIRKTVIDLNDFNKLNRLANEVLVFKLPPHPNLLKPFIQFTSPGSEKYPNAVKLFSILPLATMDLFDFFSDGHLYKCTNSFEIFLDIMIQLIDGLQHMHDHNFIHRDIKPENILLFSTPQHTYRAVLTDFDLSCSLSDTISLQKICGSPDYAAPELFNPNFQQGSLENDLFSIGAVGFVGVTGMMLDHKIINQPNTCMQTLVHDQMKHNNKLRSTCLNDGKRRHARQLFRTVISGLLDQNPSKRPPLSSIRGTFSKLLTGLQ